MPRNLPWQERIRLYCRGFEEAREEGAKCGLDVFFAWEETFKGDDYLIYGLSPEWLCAHPEMEHWSYREQFEAVHAAGGCVVQAHPFRCRDYIRMITLTKDFVDAVEVANAGNRAIEDAAALRYADEFGLYKTCGSDNHLSYPGKYEEGLIYGMALPRRVSSAGDFARLILNREPVRLCVPEERFSLTGDASEIPLVSYWTDGGNGRIPTGRSWTE